MNVYVNVLHDLVCSSSQLAPRTGRETVYARPAVNIAVNKIDI